MTVPRSMPETERQSAELAALSRMLTVSAGTFSLGVAVCNSVPLRDYLIDKLKSCHPGIKVLAVPGGVTDVLGEARSLCKESKPEALLLVNLEAGLESGQDEYPVLRSLNASRELWPKAIGTPTVFWLPEYAASLLSVHARDFWAWNSHQFEFVSETAHLASAGTDRFSGDVDLAVDLGVDEKHFRIAELRQRISEAGDPPPSKLARHVVVWLNELAVCLQVLGRVPAAVQHLRRALELSQSSNHREGVGFTSGNLGVAYAALGDVRQAIESYEKHLAIAGEMGDRRGEGTALGNLGAAYGALGGARRAIEFHEKALAIDREIGDRRGESADLGNLGLAYRDLGDARRAIEFYEQALAIHREIGDRRGEGADLGNLGLAYADLGDARRAIQFYEQALAIDREIGNRGGEGADLGNLGLAYAALGDARRAIELHEQALAIDREIGDRRGEGADLGNLGLAYAALGDAHRAIEFYEQALAIGREIGDRRGEGQNLWNMSLALRKLGQREEAVKRAEEALRIFAAIEHPAAPMLRKRLEEWRGEEKG